MTDTSSNKALTQAEHAFKTIVWDPLIIAGETWLEASVPLLEVPILKGAAELAIKELTDALYKQIVLFIDVAEIKLKQAALQSKWELMAESLGIIADEQGDNSDAYKTALAKAADEFSQFIHTGPTP